MPAIIDTACYTLVTLRKLLLRAGDIEANPGPSRTDTRSDLCIIHLNARSIKNKIDLMEAEANQFDIITVSETWLSQIDMNTSIHLTNFHPPIRRDRPNVFRPKDWWRLVRAFLKKKSIDSDEIPPIDYNKCIHKHVYNFLQYNNIITQSQSGFIRGDSTVNQLLCICNDLCSSFDKGITTQAVYLDISKAFDRVWHTGLLSKLEAVGIRGKLLNWFRDYLSCRMQATVIKGEKSDFKGVSAGVPQGSVLGPLLFLIYINDIVNTIQSVIKLFADDTSLSLALNNSDSRAKILNHDLEKN